MLSKLLCVSLNGGGKRRLATLPHLRVIRGNYKSHFDSRRH